MNEIIYCEKINLNILFILLKKLICKINLKLFYIDATPLVLKLIFMFRKWTQFEIQKLHFKMMNIKDENGNLIRLRIPHLDLIKLQQAILSSSEYRSLQKTEWSSSRFEEYLKKSLIQANILLPGSPGRVLYLIHIIHYHMKKKERSYFYLKKIPFPKVYQEYANQFNIQLKFLTPFEFFDKTSSWQRDFSIFSLIKNYAKYPSIWRIYRKLKKPQLSTRNIFPSEKLKILIEGRGDHNLEKNGMNSDFFSIIYGGIPWKQLVVICSSPVEQKLKQSFKNKKIQLVQVGRRSYDKDLSHFLPNWIHSYQPKQLYWGINSLENCFIQQKLNTYNYTRSSWKQFCEKFGVRLYASWYKFDENHMAIADAMQELDGIFSIFQLAYQGTASIDCSVSADIIFGFSQQQAEVEKQHRTKTPYYVITGYLKDDSFELLKPKAKQIRQQLQAVGCQKIVACFDENSLGDLRWHTGHELQRENYSYLLEAVLENPELGVIFKPKNQKNLKIRLAEVNKLLEKAQETGRCLVLDNSNMIEINSIPTALAVLAADVVIHGHSCAGTVAMEAALLGKRTILIDREGWKKAPWYQLGEGQVVFPDWPTAMDALMTYLTSKKEIPGFGDCSSMLEELDPFRDGHAGKRMGTYLKFLLNGFEQGLNREQNLSLAAERYVKQWGEDKIKAINC